MTDQDRIIAIARPVLIANPLMYIGEVRIYPDYRDITCQHSNERIAGKGRREMQDAVWKSVRSTSVE